MIACQRYDDVLQIRLCRYPEFIPGATVSVYLVDGLLIDTGPAHTAVELTDFLGHKKIKTAINTHFHEDHIAANFFLQERYGLEIFAPKLSVEKINKPAELYPYQEEVWGYPVPSRVKPLGGTVRTEKFLFNVIPTPGHDRDHVCLFEPDQGWLFSGDLYVGSKPIICRPGDDQWQIIRDLKTILPLNPRVLFPAPSSVIIDPVERLRNVVSHLEALGAKVQALHRRGLNSDQILQEIFGEENPSALSTDRQFSSKNMVLSFLENVSL